ncbi:hypothetical protein Pmani_040216 [Petrolisthes manimaculis]|uniref:C2H2-type domain-containing protein n=1 Tax=Petrolisthes manimaculis TaxID=1843537 RepID=A0AAE1NC69_9EUCA|nr:hypothetical protein Pmani_040216 [Petrolisthes manimaculis]
MSGAHTHHTKTISYRHATPTSLHYSHGSLHAHGTTPIPLRHLSTLFHALHLTPTSLHTHYSYSPATPISTHSPQSITPIPASRPTSNATKTPTYPAHTSYYPCSPSPTAHKPPPSSPPLLSTGPHPPPPPTAHTITPYRPKSITTHSRPPTTYTNLHPLITHTKTPTFPPSTNTKLLTLTPTTHTNPHPTTPTTHTSSHPLITHTKPLTLTPTIHTKPHPPLPTTQTKPHPTTPTTHIKIHPLPPTTPTNPPARKRVVAGCDLPRAASTHAHPANSLVLSLTRTPSRPHLPPPTPTRPSHSSLAPLSSPGARRACRVSHAHLRPRPRGGEGGEGGVGEGGEGGGDACTLVFLRGGRPSGTAIPYLLTRQRRVYTCPTCIRQFPAPNPLKGQGRVHLPRGSQAASPDSTSCPAGSPPNQPRSAFRRVGGIGAECSPSRLPPAPPHQPPGPSRSYLGAPSIHPLLLGAPPATSLLLHPRLLLGTLLPAHAHSTLPTLPMGSGARGGEGSPTPTPDPSAEMETLVSNLGRSRRGHLCLYCGKVYSRKYGLKIHIRTHTGYKPLKCQVCLRPFGDPSNLNKHVRLHAQGHTPYRCGHCGKVLVRRRDLDRHIRSRHPHHSHHTDPASTPSPSPSTDHENDLEPIDEDEDEDEVLEVTQADLTTHHHHT